jgi:hypothetical protein
MTATRNLTIVQGTKFQLGFRKSVAVVGQMGPVNTPVALTGLQARAHFRRTYADEYPMLILQSDPGSVGYSTSGYLTVEPLGDTGVIQMFIGSSLTSRLDSSGVWSLELYYPANPELDETLVSGNFNLVREATR